MKKSNFVALILGTISGIFFALGMCMAMLPEWNAFKPGVTMGLIGIIIGFITVFIWRKMEKKDPIKITGKAALTCIVAIVGSLGLGIGMCNVMVWDNLVSGILIGSIGILVLICLIPIYKGIQ